MYANSLNDSYSAIIPKYNKKADSKESAFMANPVDYDTRDGCTTVGCRKGFIAPYGKQPLDTTMAYSLFD